MDPEPPSVLIFLSAIGGAAILKFVLVLFLLACSALISGAEVALFSLSPSDINGEEKTVKGTIISQLLQKPKKLLATILVANNFINIAVVLLFDSVSDLLFKGIDYKWYGFIDVKFFLEIIVITFLILMFGEILPKIYASRNKVKFAYFMAHPLNILDKLFSPLSLPMRSITLYLQEKLGKQKSNLSVNHLSQALELTSEEDTTKEEKKILEGIVSFGNTDTRQVMRPRIDIFALNEEIAFEQIIPEIIKNGYSRIPVYKENMDNVTGVLYVKDLLPYINRSSFNWVKLKREAYFIPENKKLDDLLREFQEMKNHLAIVVDEYGGTSGLVTLEDIIEEIMGEISDEFDDEDLIYSKLDDYNYVFEGKTSLKDFYRVLKVQDEEPFEHQKGESETIAGFVLEIAGKFPKRGDKITFNQYAFTIEALDRKRIKQIKVSVQS
ncbi:gliding motility-associated protein GldE [Leptobacterium sp. I13]|uniref:gliding motility-associated protein GldE n=1 Tax=Leptobacterium meishanense TaxID=3128904 RepID=UPI0030ED7443